MDNIKSIHMKKPGLENHDLEIKILEKPISLTNADESKQQYISHILGKQCDCIATLKTTNGVDNWAVAQAYFSKGKFLIATIIDPTDVHLQEKDKYIQNVLDFKKTIEREFSNGYGKVSYNLFSQTIRESKIANKYKESIRDLYDNPILNRF
jgi:hypothetical protein